MFCSVCLLKIYFLFKATNFTWYVWALSFNTTVFLHLDINDNISLSIVWKYVDISFSWKLFNCSVTVLNLRGRETFEMKNLCEVWPWITMPIIYLQYYFLLHLFFIFCRKKKYFLNSKKAIAKLLILYKKNNLKK